MQYLDCSVLTFRPQGRPQLTGVDVLVCENNYRDKDADLAERTFHMTSSGVANLAEAVKARHLVLFHLSDRYRPEEWLELLSDVKGRFPKASFPVEWQSVF